MREQRVPAGPRGRAARYKRWRDQALALLSDEERNALYRARAGLPPGGILGPIDDQGAGEAVAVGLLRVEQISRKLLGGYEWPEGDGRHYPPSGFADVFVGGGWRPVGPDWTPEAGRSQLRYDAGADKVCTRYDQDSAPIEGQPDIRFELLTLLLLVAETRAALDTSNPCSAVLRALTIGSLIGHVAYMLLDGAAVAATAATDASRESAHRSLRENFDEKLDDRERELARLDSLTSGISKRGRAINIKKGWRNVGGLDKWVDAYNKARADNARDNGDQPSKPVKKLSVDEISRKLPTRR